MNGIHPIKKLLLERIATGLRRSAITTCSRWAEAYRVMGEPFPGKWTFDHHWWLLEMSDSEAQHNVGQKAAQLGFTEWALNRALFAMDVHGLNVLYILPTDGDASDFSAARFDKALENSRYLSNFFSNVKNVGHKRAGNTSLYVRGSNSRSKLKSIDTALIVYDELDEMNQKNLALASERQSGQRVETKQDLKISTPTIEDKGINADFKKSTQEFYHFKCPSCSRLIELRFPESIVITADSILDKRVHESHYICNQCKGRLPSVMKDGKCELLKSYLRGGTGRFVPSHNDREIRGFHVNQMYSSTITPGEYALSYLKGLLDPTDATEFWNSKNGLPYAAEGSKVSENDIIACQKAAEYFQGKSPNTMRYKTMGIDIGGVNHFSIEEWILPVDRTPGLMLNDEATPRLLKEGNTSGKATDFDELLELFLDYEVDFAVVDAEPERRQAYQFATKLWGRVLLCDWLWTQQGRQLLVGPKEECTIKANRTSWFDLALGRFKNRSIYLPRDLSDQYSAHVREPQRVYKKDKFGNPFGYYESVKPDHLALTRVYSELALPFAVSYRENMDIEDLF